MLNPLQRLLSRPALLWPYVRGYWLFLRTRFLLSFLQNLQPNIRRGRNVRQQRLRCVYTDGPSAKIELGAHSIIYEDAQIGAIEQGQIELGEFSVIGRTQIFSRAQIKIGARLITSWNVLIQDYDPHPTEAELRASQIENIAYGFRPRLEPLTPADLSRASEVRKAMQSWKPESSPISIGDNVWIGANSCIFKGAKIGSHCVVAANSVVTGGIFEDYSLIAGTPAKIIKKLN